MYFVNGQVNSKRKDFNETIKTPLQEIPKQLSNRNRGNILVSIAMGF